MVITGGGHSLRVCKHCTAADEGTRESARAKERRGEICSLATTSPLPSPTSPSPPDSKLQPPLFSPFPFTSSLTWVTAFVACFANTLHRHLLCVALLIPLPFHLPSCGVIIYSLTPHSTKSEREREREGERERE